ncbi:PD-(D/E)XK nuclease family protein [Lacinutrix sp. 5H-3-7-4]|uniref:PD-(D/E)XK nuclease family protein n=1 Tax=Lacinutrix sp. (strain 5H-3-7-4) TaxID=983544 RepID=UPI00020A3C1A|nr:PD-(D/E)XK nuclease family protein [Lacinutrix sp. 5H-3-7-4]AEH01982.1 hypothetical protein Lacal_2136 [Lacinutrix sp. 5H-3-7-4]
MNIFKILANGHGSINENNISAFLGYLLDPKADHSLGYTFLEKFLEPVISKDENFNIYKYDYKVFFEQGKEQRVDIVIVCYTDENYSGKNSQMINFLTAKKSIHKVFLIENKITLTSRTVDQLEKQIKSTTSELSKLKDFEIDNVDIYSIYTTPEDDKFDLEFKNLTTNNNKTHIYWDNKDDEKSNTTIRSILERLLKDENNAKIETINTYTKDTIKSFIQFIDNGFKSEIAEEEVMKENLTIPVELVPSNADDFKTAFLKKGVATERYHYDDGRIEEKLWKVTKFNEDSNLMRNIYSKNISRKGKWIDLGITKLEIVVY